MANRRMFSRRIINSARFIKLTKDAQVLYFHLCMNADDDGAVEGFPVRRALGIEEDAYANLEGRGFIITLDRENEIVYITDWLEHNKIRADRLQASLYRDLISNVVGNKVLIEPKKRSDLKGSNVVDVSAGTELDGRTKDSPRTDNGQSTDGPRTDNGQAMDRLGKDRIGKDKISKDKLVEDSKEGKPKRKRFVPPTIEDVISYINEKGYLNVNANKWFSHYAANGWMVGKNKMKDWKRSVDYWHHNNNDSLQPQQQSIGIIQHTEAEQAIDWGDSL